jgi:hypothetical protein
MEEKGLPVAPKTRICDAIPKNFRVANQMGIVLTEETPFVSKKNLGFIRDGFN